MKIALGTASKMKEAAVRLIATECWPGETIEIFSYPVESGVPETPHNDETYVGAKNRAQGAQKLNPEAEFSIGVESGLIERYGHIYEEAWAVCFDRSGKEYAGYSSGLRVPDSVLQQMKTLGKTHAEVMTILEQQYQGQPSNDTWGSYTGGTLLRQTSIEEAIRNVMKQITAPDKSFYRLPSA